MTANYIKNIIRILGGESNALWIMQEIDISPCEEALHAQPRIHPGKWDAQSSLVFGNIHGSPNLGQTTRTKKKKENWWNNRFAVPADHSVKLKEKEKMVKYLDLAKEL